MNQQKYWLKGGILAGFFGLIYCFVIYFRIITSNPLQFYWYKLPADIASIIIYIGWQGDKDPTFLNHAGMYTIIFLEFLIAGIVIGWIYGKIKNK